MSKSILNARPCACCHRLMALKSGKRKTCSGRCAQITRGRASLHNKHMKAARTPLRVMPFYGGLK